MKLLIQFSAIGGLRRRLSQFEGSTHRLQQGFVLPGFGHKIGGTNFHPFHRQFNRTPTGEEDNGQCWVKAFDFAQGAEAIRSGSFNGKIHVQNGQFGRMFLQETQGLSRRTGGAYFEALLLEQQRQGSLNGNIVIDEQQQACLRFKDEYGNIHFLDDFMGQSTAQNSIPKALAVGR